MELKCKISLLGDQRVGKTSLIVRYIEDTFQSEYIATFGADFVEKEFTSETLPQLKKNDTFSLVIWDLAGHSHFEDIASFYLQGSAGIILVFDITNKESLTNILKWKGFCDRFCPNARILVVGNKTDLESAVSPGDIENIEKKLSTNVIMASAKLDKNVDNIFETMAKKIISTMKKVDKS